MGKLVRFQYSAATVSPERQLGGGNKSEYRSYVFTYIPEQDNSLIFRNLICRQAVFYLPKMLKRNYKIIILIILVLGLGIAGQKIWKCCFLNGLAELRSPKEIQLSEGLDLPGADTKGPEKNNIPKFSENRGPGQEIISEPLNKQYATLEIEEESYQGEIENGTNVYDFMAKIKGEGKIDFKEKNYTGLGKFIYEINGVPNAGTKNWIFYVNGKKSGLGVSSYKLKPGDVVSWKFEEEY